jgi:hypothetical protein
LGVLVRELSPLMREMICRYLSFRAHGFKNAKPDCNPTACKSVTLLNIKKKISFFIINCLPTWDEIHKTGNPTKSAIMIDLIGAIKKKETHGQGNPSCTDRPFEPSKLSQALTCLQESDNSDFDWKYQYLAILSSCSTLLLVETMQLMYSSPYSSQAQSTLGCSRASYAGQRMSASTVTAHI